MLAPSLGRWGPVDIYGGWNVWGQSGEREKEKREATKFEKRGGREDATKGFLAAWLAPGTICRQQDGMVFPLVAKVTYGPPLQLPPCTVVLVKLTRTATLPASHALLHGENTDRKIWQRVRECTRVQWILDPALLRTAMLNSLSAFSAFSVASFLPFSFFHDFRWRTDDRRASLAASYRVSEFLEVYSKETEYKISREFMKKVVFISLCSNSCVKFCSRDSRIPRVEDFIGVEVSRVY